MSIISSIFFFLAIASSLLETHTRSLACRTTKKTTLHCKYFYFSTFQVNLVQNNGQFKFADQANYTTGQLIHDKVAGPSMSQIVHYQKSRPSAFSSKLHDLDENSQETG
jgi:hypothetical protein